MRRLPQGLNYGPRIFLLKFSQFFVFGAFALLERFFIEDGLIAFGAIVATYFAFIAFDKFVQPHFFFYLVAKVNHFERPHYLEDSDETSDFDKKWK